MIVKIFIITYSIIIQVKMRLIYETGSVAYTGISANETEDCKN